MKQTIYALLVGLWMQQAQAQLTLVKDIYPGNTGSNPSGFCVMNGKVYFSASTYDSAIGLPGHTERELWVSDGSAAGTVKVYDLNAGSFGTTANPASIVSVNNNLFYTGNYSGGTQLWTSNGTSAGTKTLVTSGYPDAFAGAPNMGLMPYGNKVLFVANETSNFIKGLYQSDGTPAGTSKLKACKLPSGPISYANLNGILYMMLGLNNYYGISRTDGTPAGTSEVVAFKTFALSNPAVLNNSLYFIGDTSGWNHELWKSDGTKAGTVWVKDIFPGNTGCNMLLTPLVKSGNRLFFWADNGTNGTELWSSDGTTAGTVMVQDLTPGSSASAYYNNLMLPINNRVVFSIQDMNTSVSTLWSSDGTAAGTFKLLDSVKGPVPNGQNYTYAGNELIFSEGNKIYATNGTLAGTRILINTAGANPIYLFDLIYANNLILVSGIDNNNDGELYKLPFSGPNGVKEYQSEPGFTVYPNPATTEIYLGHSTARDAVVFTLNDQTGKTYLVEQQYQPGNPISLRHLAPGFYFYTIQATSGQIQTGKLIIHGNH